MDFCNFIHLFLGPNRTIWDTSSHIGKSLAVLKKFWLKSRSILYDFLVTVKAAPHECVIRTGQP